MATMLMVYFLTFKSIKITKKGGAVWRCMPLATCICL